MSDEIKVSEEKSVSEELKEFNKEVLGKLDSPLVVHRKGDASYEENAAQYEMNETHTGEERPTLQRHRFKKEKKKSNAPIVIIILFVVLAAALAGLYFSGNIRFDAQQTTGTATTAQTTEGASEELDRFNGTIVIKDVYIFVDGEEVDGSGELQRALRYEEPNPRRYKLILENENSSFYNFEVLPILENMGFFDDTTEVEHVSSTGLIADAETTTLPPETTESKKKNKKKNKKKADKQN